MVSLRGRLAGWLVATLVALVAVHWVVSGLAPRFIAQEYVAARLSHDAESLLAGLHIGTEGELTLDPAYVAPVYHRPFSGHYFVVKGAGNRIRSRSLWDEDLDVPVPGTPGEFWVSDGWGPRGQPVLLWAAAFLLEGSPVGIVVAEDLTPIRTYLAQLHLWFTLGTLGLLVLLVLAQRAIVRWSLRPLDRVRDDCRRLEAGEVERLGEDVPAEVRPLVGEVNRLLGVLNQRLERSRKSLANLAHAIKGPLTLLAHASDSPDQSPCAADVRQAVARVREVVDRELRRARVAGGPTSTRRFFPAQELPDLVGVLGQVHADRELVFDVAAPEGLSFRGDREDLLELFGNLLDNAAKWATGRVELQFTQGPGLAFTVEDDGPGVPADALSQLAGRGVRLDEAVPGHGIGLAIVREICEQYGGTLAFGRSDRLGGLRVEVRLPG